MGGFISFGLIDMGLILMGFGSEGDSMAFGSAGGPVMQRPGATAARAAGYSGPIVRFCGGLRSAGDLLLFGRGRTPLLFRHNPTAGWTWIMLSLQIRQIPEAAE